MRTAGNAAPSAPQRQTTIGYDAATGRIATMLANGSNVPFTWSYLPGSDLKSSLTYPNGLTASWTYDANSQLLQVRNAVVATAPSPSETEVISQYDYAYDAAGRRIEIARSGTAMSESRTDAYGYNVRNELTSATKLGGPASVPATLEYAYQYEDIGNRLSSLDLGTNRTYTANFLNQYTLISNLCDSVTLCDDFVPQYDLDGNQTLVKTSTGVWQVSYNGENRPVSWTCGTTNIVMAYDRMGRRVSYLETVSGGSPSPATVVTNANHTFVYDGYLCLRRLDAATKKADMFFTWDPAESVATRLLMVERPGKYKMHVTHDGNKNVSELVFFSGGSGIAAHYEYAPFGAVTASTRSTSVTAYDFREYNPFRFSSEYADDTLGLVYYNYRHYNPLDGRWTSRDPVESSNQYAILRIVNHYDWLGLRVLTWDDFTPVGQIPGASHTAKITTRWKLLPGELNIRIIKYHGDDCKGALRVRTNKETAQRETYINSQCPCDECAEAEIAYSHATVRVEIIKDQTLVNTNRLDVTTGSMDKELLLHEQGHWNISEKIASETQDRIRAIKVKSERFCTSGWARYYARAQKNRLEDLIYDEFDSGWSRKKQTDLRYDEETQHGAENEKQKEWNEKWPTSN